MDKFSTRFFVFSLGNNGCEGGYMDYAFVYMKEKGIESEKAYPYKAQDDKCAYKPSKKVASDTGYVDIKPGNETLLEIAVATVGPISVAFDASQPSFQMYSSGVYNEPACSSTEIDHSAVIVGYDTDPTGGDYYIVKNSWGTSWGQQ